MKIYKKFTKIFNIADIKFKIEIEYTNFFNSTYKVLISSINEMPFEIEGSVDTVNKLPELILTMKEKLTNEINEVNENINKINNFLNEL